MTLEHRESYLVLLAGLLVVVLGTLAIGLLFTTVADTVNADDVDGAVPEDYHLDPVSQDAIEDRVDEDLAPGEVRVTNAFVEGDPDDPDDRDRVVSTTSRGPDPAADLGRRSP